MNRKNKTMLMGVALGLGVALFLPQVFSQIAGLLGKSVTYE